ncbi:MAG TPA: hypothetical protein VL171_09810 [Verrucomicrobiae bacterium]|nr:hypothetical protein [Verrucomicrobiae bacterium]
MNEYVISIEEISSRRLECRWEPNPFPGYPNSFWVEYPSTLKRAAGVTSLYLALPASLPLSFTESRFRIESSLIEPQAGGNEVDALRQILNGWPHFVKNITARHFGRAVEIHMEPPVMLPGADTPCHSLESAQRKTGLFFGGGAESLLVLGELLAKGIKPILISFLGPGWIGSDPVRNPTKLEQDSRIASQLGLQLRHIHSNVYGVLAQLQPALQERIVTGTLFANAVSFTPSLLALVAPLVVDEELSTVCQGNEIQQFGEDLSFHCFTPEITGPLSAIFAPLFDYQPWLGEMNKLTVFENLWTRHPSIGHYQYSCYANRGERWCLNCEKCFRYYVLYRLYGVPFETVEFNEERFLSNLAQPGCTVFDELLDGEYRQDTYQTLLKTAVEQNKSDVERFLARCLQQARWQQRRRQMKALLRPMVPPPILRFMRAVRN